MQFKKPNHFDELWYTEFFEEYRFEGAKLPTFTRPGVLGDADELGECYSYVSTSDMKISLCGYHSTECKVLT